MTLKKVTQNKYYDKLSASATPVAHVESGDIIVTHTLDCGGLDSKLKYRGVSTNPMCGPFYVKGAEPGDMLAVKFISIVPDRKIGFSSAHIEPTTFNSDYAVKIKAGMPLWNEVKWVINSKKGTVKPVGIRFPELKMEPMTGCFGVAPSGGKKISTATSGSHGGNMDYKGFKSGVTAYLPVFVEGAYFFIGDGHAVQGVGEVTGTGVEVSCEMKFSLNVIKGKKISWPRGEDSKYIFTVGCGRPLDAALRASVGEMHAWLKEVKLKEKEIALIFGQCVNFEIGNMYDPNYTVACRVNKKYLH